MSKKVSTAEQYRNFTARKINKNLWEATKKLSKGTTEDKISAVNTLFKEHYKLPKECIQISEELADKNQPLKVRIQIANNLIKYQSIPFGMHQSLIKILLESNNSKIIKIISKSSLMMMSKSIQIIAKNFVFPDIYSIILKPIQEFAKKFDWGKFRKAYHASMLRELNAVKDDRITAILGQVLAEYWLDVFMKNLFHNSKELLEFSFDKKRKILYGLKVLKSTTDNDLKKLDDIRAEYAHNFVADKKKVLGHLEKMDCYKNMTFGKNSKNNNRIKKCAIKLVLDLMDIEEQFIIEIKKKEKPKKKEL